MVLNPGGRCHMFLESLRTSRAMEPSLMIRCCAIQVATASPGGHEDKLFAARAVLKLKLQEIGSLSASRKVRGSGLSIYVFRIATAAL
jgi:hypothetical protein